MQRFLVFTYVKPSSKYLADLPEQYGFLGGEDCGIDY